MRDLLIAAVIFGSLPFILRRPYVGILVWSWVSYMNPHRLAWGFAYDFPFAQVVGITTIVGIFFSRESKAIPWKPLTVIWLLFVVWMIVTTIFAIYPDDAFEQLKKVLKIQLVTFLTMMLINSRERLNMLIWVIVVSIGFYSVKGGLFTLLSGGASRVYGPERSFISDNNAMALATLMVVPLMEYLRLQTANRWVRLALLVAILLSAASVLGSHSRGAFVAGVAVCALLWARSNRKLVAVVIFAGAVVPLVVLMPENWHQRIGTISLDSTADVRDIESMRTRHGEGRISAPIASRDWLGYWPNDFSALGRVNAWNYSINVANDRPTGAGFSSWTRSTFARYAPIVEEVQAAHSIVFSILADHGWIGLFLFVTILALGWRNASWVIVRSRDDPSLRWARDLMRMVQVSLLAYLVGGAFLSLAYFDLPWHLIAVVLICMNLTEQHLAAKRRPATTNALATDKKAAGDGPEAAVTHLSQGAGDR